MSDAAEVAVAGKMPRSVAIAEKGITTSKDFANTMSAIMADVGAGRLTPQVGNAMVNAGGKLLKVVEMQLRYGTSGPGQDKVLVLADAIQQRG